MLYIYIDTCISVCLSVCMYVRLCMYAYGCSEYGVCVYIYMVPPQLSTGCGVNPVTAGPDPLTPHSPTSLKDYSISMCTVCLQN